MTAAVENENGASSLTDPVRVRAFGQRLARTELLFGDELRAYQAPFLTKLLAHARETTDFYRDRLPVDATSADSIEGAWLEIPILTRAEAVANQERLISRNIPSESGASIDGETSGSTGMPLQFKRTAQVHLASIALSERMYRWWRVDGKKTFALVTYDRTHTPHVSVSRGWHSARPNGLRYVLSHAFDIDAMLAWLSDKRPNYFGAYSSILNGLALAARDRNTGLKFDLLFSFATVLDPEVRALCRSVFGAEIADTYGSQEVGHIAAQCPSCGEYHVSADAALVEILRDDGTPASPGEVGRVIVTPFYNYAMPFIRYELGDLAEVGTARPSCGIGLPTLRRILGRYRNLFRFRDGTTIWPIPGRFRSAIGLKQFQVVQTEFDQVEIRYVPEAGDRPIDVAAVAESVSQALRRPMQVTFRAVETIPRSRTGKYEDFISLVGSR